MRVQVRDVRLYFDVAGMGLVPDGAVMREAAGTGLPPWRSGL
jgi:hypothetical protein